MSPSAMLNMSSAGAPRPSVLVTGASGFVGQALVRLFVKQGFPVQGGVRSASSPLPEGATRLILGDVSNKFARMPALEGFEVVVHCAARVHRMEDGKAGSLAAYRAVNRDASVRLAREAAAVGVRRFVFLSSIKVNGEATEPGAPFRADRPPSPRDAYAQSKYEAEVELAKVAAETGMELVIVRPPLVYGPGVKANFLTMLRWVDSGWPLPLGSVENRRSLVFIDNLVDLVSLTATHPDAAGRTFRVSDGESLSTAALLRRCAEAMHRPSTLLRVPPRWLHAVAVAVGRTTWANRLFSSLEVEIEPTRKVLGWNPPIGVDEALVRTAQDFLLRK